MGFLAAINNKFKKDYVVTVDVCIEDRIIQTIEVPVRAYTKWQASNIANVWAHKNMKIKVDKINDASKKKAKSSFNTINK